MSDPNTYIRHIDTPTEAVLIRALDSRKELHSADDAAAILERALGAALSGPVPTKDGNDANA